MTGRPEGQGGPVPVRDLMKKLAGEPEPKREQPADRRWSGVEQAFEWQDETWVARPAGVGAYGTGRRGTARLLAVHFCREADPATPVREALVPAGSFPYLQPEELVRLMERATPIELDR